MREYPECEKLAKLADLSHKIGEFFDWLGEQDMVLFKWNEESDNGESKFIDKNGESVHNVHSQFLFDDKPTSDILNPKYETYPEGYFRVFTSMEKLLAEFFGIDLNKVEKERRLLLEELRELQKNKKNG